MYNGLLNIYKEKDFTSHDVVAKLRGILRQKKIGHTGTLDPNAEGVLPVCLGKGTKLCDMLTGTKKQYKVSFVFEKEASFFEYFIGKRCFFLLFSLPLCLSNIKIV